MNAYARLRVCSRCLQWSSSSLTEGLLTQRVIHATRQTAIFQRYLPIATVQVRYKHSFWTSRQGEDLWKGVTSVSNAGRKRGRASRGKLKRKTELNKGQMIGSGKYNTVWPGLNTHILKGNELLRISKQPPNPDREKEILAARDKVGGFTRMTVPALQRGWSGSKWPGMSIGPPDPIGDYKFEGFDTRVLEFKSVSTMTGNMGRKQRFSAFVVTGNKNGLAGYGLGKSPNARAAMRKAKNKAGQTLQFVERFEDHTVYHNIFTQFMRTSIFVYKQDKGYGMECHRALKTMCDIIGITNMYAKVEGRTKNIQNLTKAFFKGLREQETHQQLADRTGLYVVERRKQHDDLPIVIAKPTQDKERKTIKLEEDLNFERLYYDGKVPHIKPKRDPFYFKLESYYHYKNRKYKERNQAASRVERLVIGLEKPPQGGPLVAPKELWGQQFRVKRDTDDS